MAIQGITNTKIQEINAKSPANLPDRPYDYGFTPAQVKQAFIAPITDEENSIAAEVNRIVAALNSLIEGETSISLSTVAQTIIGAINELNENKAESDDIAAASDIGDVDELTTTAETVVGAINEIVSALATIDTALAGKQATLTFDSSPTASSDNPVKSGGVYTALGGKADLVDGKVPAAQLPSYVDDVLEYSATTDFPAEGETGKIYVDKTTNKTYRWGGSAYTEISASLGLGETSATAFPGNRGKAAEQAITALQTEKQDALTFDNEPTANSDNPVKSSGIKNALEAKQNTLSFDSAPTQNSTNPVTSGGVYTAVSALTSAIGDIDTILDSINGEVV